jgi:hypothetical protein
MASLLWQQQQLGYVPHTSVSGEAWQCVRAGTATSFFNDTATTEIYTNSDSGGADTWNGLYWIEMRSGTCKGEWKRIVDDDGAGTVTLENNGFSAQIDSGDEFALWLSPEPIVAVDSSSGETNIVDATRSEADDFWNGYYLVAISGNKRGKAPVLITDFVSSTGTFTVAAGLGAAADAGDVFVIRKFIEKQQPSESLTHAWIGRPSHRNNFSRGDGITGARGGSISFASHIYPSASLAASGSVANKSVLSGLLQACGLVENQDTSATVGTGSTTSAIKIATASWENFTVGNMVVWNGNPTWITSLVDGAGAEDTVNVTPPLPQAPAATDVLYAANGYHKSLTGNELGCVVEWEADGYRFTVTGCKGNVTLQSGEPPMLQFEMQSGHWIEELEAAPYNAGTAYTTAGPVLETDRKAWLDTTKTNIGTFTASPNAEVSPRNVQGSTGANGNVGHQFTNFAHGASWRELMDSSDTSLTQNERWLARTAKDVIVAMGSHGRIFAVRLPVARQIERSKPEDADGQIGVRCVWEAQDAGTATDGDSATQKIPDWGFFIS